MANDMQVKFHALGKQKAEILEKSKPLREQYEALRAKQQAIELEIKPVKAAMREIEAPLFDIDNERGALARALNGKTGTA